MSSRHRGRSGRLAAVLLVAITTTLAGCGGRDVTKPPTSLPIGTVVPDFHIQDVNPNSVTTGQDVSPRSHLGQVSAWYFAHATWGYCRTQFGFLQQMQVDVDTVATAVPIRITGINKAGEESDNALMCQGRTLPWLQDTPGANVWAAWQANWRDVVVLDGENKIVAIYNLTANNLAVPEKYAELRAILLNAAQ